jgi:small-conductance mechanosensitive channel
VGIDLTVLSVFGGALGVGLGFGLQKIASNYVSGFIILLDRSIRIGDRLMVDNRVGYVSKITSRFVVLKSADGSEALVPNDTLIANTVINQSYTDKSLWISLPIQVAYGTDLHQALALLCQAASHPRVKTDPAPSAFVVAFADSGINLEVGLWVSDPENGMLSLRSDINLRIWQLFSQHGIQIPYPQREVHVLNHGNGEA